MDIAFPLTAPPATQTSTSEGGYFDSFDPKQARQRDLLSGSNEREEWLSLVSRVRSDDPTASEELYSILYQRIRPYMIQRIGIAEIDDRFHDTLLIIIGAIRSDSLREPARLMGFAQTVARRQISASIRAVIKRRRASVEHCFNLRSVSDPENEMARNEEKHMTQGMIASLSSRQREILVRFYVEEQPVAQICTAMDLTETQFRLLKSRAKARLTMKCGNKVSKRAFTLGAAPRKAV